MNTSDPDLNSRILIVDDNATIHADFQEILCPEAQASGQTEEMETTLFGEAPREANATVFELDSAYQGEEALAMVERSIATNRPYAMAFVDVRMPPGWDGVETIAHLWEVCPTLQVVVCTAYADYSWEEMRARVGQPDSLVILKKPFDNIEVQQLAHALTKKWWLNLRSELQLAELARANASLAVSEERFSKAFKENPVPSAIQSLPDQRFVDVNERFVQATDCPRELLIGRTPQELGLWESPVEAWYEALARQEPLRHQSAKIRTRGGAIREMLVSLAPVAMARQPHALLLAEDISERALLERQLRQAQKMEAIGQLAAGVAHDFNNILTIIQGHAGLLHQKWNGGSLEGKSLDQISQAASRASTLIRQLLMFSRKQVMQFRNVDLNVVLRDAFKMLGRLVGEHVEIDLQLQEALPAIYADVSMVEQVAMNLAVNARDAMPDGGRVTIRTSLEQISRGPTPMDPEPRNGQYVCMTFSDAGTGMDTTILSRIFEPFFTTKPPGKGTGLGLSTVFGIVRQHKGWLEVTSQPGQGTTFRIFFAVSGRPAEKVPPVTDTGLRSGSETVLVAEDEDALRQMVVDALKVQGYSVLEAASGREALAVWEQSKRHIDLLLTDMVMPGGIMGSELAERLTQNSPSLKVIYTSGYSPGIAGKDTSLLGRRNFLPKPFSIGTLSRFVRECLDAPAKAN